MKYFTASGLLRVGVSRNGEYEMAREQSGGNRDALKLR